MLGGSTNFFYIQKTIRVIGMKDNPYIECKEWEPFRYLNNQPVLNNGTQMTLSVSVDLF